MDKLRAIHYFNRAVEHGSFAAAARACDVTTAAVTQLVAALEQSLGAPLFHRSRHGLALTADGERYYEITRQILQSLHDVEQALDQHGRRPRGRLTVGFRQSLGQNCVMPHIARFLSRFPDIELVLKPITTVQELHERMVDIAVLIGWPPEGDLIVRILAPTELIVCASPAYWEHAGMPQHPQDLGQHHCLVLRSSGGALLDRWIFEKNGSTHTVDVRARFFSDDGGMLYQAACGGAGVIRIVDITLRQFLSSGHLVRALTDWKALEAPAIFAAFEKRQRQSKLVHVFLDFLHEVFAEGDTRSLRAATPRLRPPEWFGRTQGRQSAYNARPRRPAG